MSKKSSRPIRTFFYWCHLIVAVTFAAIILLMSATGTLLTYEHQIKEAYAARIDVPEAQRLSLEDLTQKATAFRGSAPRALLVEREEARPVQFIYGRNDTIELNPYTGSDVPLENQEVKDFFRFVMYLHRWLALEGENRTIGRWITGVSNLGFLFLAISGIYLWLPAVMRWAKLKKLLWFSRYKNGTARDFHWHHIFGIWSVLPLIAIIMTGSMFFFPWARTLLLDVFAAEQGGIQRVSSAMTPATRAKFAPLENPSLDQLFESVASYKAGWQRIRIEKPAGTAERVHFQLDTGTGRNPQAKTEIYLDADNGKLRKIARFEDMADPRKTRVFLRFLHTGEVYGLVGQTVAGLVSIFTMILIWTGLALAWRKYIRPLFKK